MDKPLQVERFPAGLRRSLRMKVAELGTTMRQFILDAVRYAIDNNVIGKK